MQKRNIIVFAVIVALIIGNVFQFMQNYSRFPRNLVSNEEIAESIARTIFSEYLEPIHLQSGEYLYWSFETTLNRLRGVWIVSAYLDIPEGVLINYSALEITIRMQDGKIMSLRSR